MIIMINGAFGVGKTTVAAQLTERLPQSMLYDPEQVGFMLRNLIGNNIKTEDERTDNFQDLELWRVLTVEVAGRIKNKYRKHLIVPMTISNKIYFDYIRKGFEEIDKMTFHFCLMANENTIHERLRKRGESEGGWASKQTRQCLTAYEDECFKEYVDTESNSIDEIVTEIEAQIRKLIGCP